MKSFSKFAIGIFTVVVASNSFANITSSTIPLDGGTILPGSNFYIVTDKLYQKHEYTIFCTIKNSNPLSEEQSAISFSRNWNANVYIDNTLVKLGTETVSHFNSDGSILKIERASKGDNVELRNLDYTDTYSVSECNAYLNG